MNILLTSVGRRAYLIDYFKEALNNNGKVYATNSEYTYSLSIADGYFISPLIYSDNYIETLLAKCLELKITVIISCFDIDLYILSENKKVFEKNGIIVIVSDANVIEVCNDKLLTSLFCEKAGFSSPKTYLDINQVHMALDSNLVTFPLILKPRWGMGSIGVYCADDLYELGIFYKKVLKEIKNSYLKYKSSIDWNSCVLFQEKLIGKEYNLDIINDLNGNYVVTVAKLKIQMRAGETDVAKIECNRSLELFGEKVSKELRHIANLDLDCILSHNKIHIIDMNCRFGGGFPFSYLAGVNLPLQIVNWISGKVTDKNVLKIKHYGMFCKNIMPVKMFEDKI